MGELGVAVRHVRVVSCQGREDVSQGAERLVDAAGLLLALALHLGPVQALAAIAAFLSQSTIAEPTKLLHSLSLKSDSECRALDVHHFHYLGCNKVICSGCKGCVPASQVDQVEAAQ